MQKEPPRNHRKSRRRPFRRPQLSLSVLHSRIRSRLMQAESGWSDVCFCGHCGLEVGVAQGPLRAHDRTFAPANVEDEHSALLIQCRSAAYSNANTRFQSFFISTTVHLLIAAASSALSNFPKCDVRS